MNARTAPQLRTHLALLLLLSVAAPTMPLLAATAAAGPNALTGSWEYDPTGSRFDGGVPYRSGTARFTATRQCLQAVVDIVEATGLKLHFEYCDPADGSFVPVTGNPFYDNESTTWVDRLTARRTERRGQLVIGITQFTFAPDGASYFTTSSRKRPDGKQYDSVIHWKRVAR